MTENKTSPPFPILRGLGAFSAVHFPYSLFAIFLSNTLYGLLFASELHRILALGPMSFFLGALPFIIPYFLLGLLMGHFAWSRLQSRRELVCNILIQTAIAWSWAAVVLLVLTSMEMAGDRLGVTVALMVPILPVTLFLAFPSCLFVLGGLDWLGAGTPLLAMALWAIPAGALPPLLFNLGNYLASRRRVGAGPPPSEGDKKSEVF